jgi:hypothetical protein
VCSLTCRVQNGRGGVSRDQDEVERKNDGRSPEEQHRTGGLPADSDSSDHRTRQHLPLALIRLLSPGVICQFASWLAYVGCPCAGSGLSRWAPLR